MSDSQQDLKARKAALMAAREKREAERAATRERLELERLELEDKYERELGPIGSAFDVVDISDVSLDHPFVVVKLGDAMYFRRFKGLTAEQMELIEHQQAFVADNCVVPGADKFRELTTARPGVAVRVVNALLGLYGLEVGKRQGK